MMSVSAGVVAVALIVAGVPPLVVAAFGLLVGAGFYLPGSLLAPRDLRCHERLAVATALGLVVCATSWAAALWLGIPPRISFVVPAILAFLSLTRGSWRPGAGADPAVLAVALVGALSVAWTQFWDGRFVADGAIRFTSSYAAEALFHSALAQELRHSLPMEFPAGASLPYHVAFNVLAALTGEATGASLLDVTYRLLPALLVPLAAVGAAAFAESAGAARAGAVAAALFLFFADDLSWIFGVTRAAGPSAASWNLLLGAPLLYALHHNRGFLAGVALLFPALVLVARYLRVGELRVLMPAALLVAALFELKVTFFLTLVPAVAATALVAALVGEGGARRSVLGRGIAVLAVASLLVLPLVVPMLGTGRGGQPPLVWAPGEAGVLPLIRLGIVAGDVVHGVPAGETGPLARTVGVVLFLAGSMGVRALGVLALPGSWRRRDVGTWLALATVLFGAAATALLVTPPARLNSIYFWGTGLAVLAALAGLAAPEALRRMTRRRRILAASAIVLLGLPGTIQMLWVERSLRTRAVLVAPAGTKEAAEWLSTNARPGDVLLEPPTRVSFLAALAPVRPVIAWPGWIANTLGEEPVAARIDDSALFFSAAAPERREAVLERYGVAWVWVPRGAECPPLSRLSLEAETPAGRVYSVTRSSS